MKKIVAYLLMLLSIPMFYFSYKMSGFPPAITGIGFLLIALVFIKEE